MFFMIGVFPQRKVLDYHQIMLCPLCSRQIKVQVIQTCSCFSLFFIPLFKWNKMYHVECEQCHCVYELDPTVGVRIAQGENVLIQETDLRPLQQPVYEDRCSFCGHNVQSDFDFCPKCGNKLK